MSIRCYICDHKPIADSNLTLSHGDNRPICNKCITMSLNVIDEDRRQKDGEYPTVADTPIKEVLEAQIVGSPTPGKRVVPVFYGDTD